MFFKKALSADQSVTQRRFRLLRNFSLVSLSSFVLATGLLSMLYRQQAVRDVVTLTEKNNVALTQFFANTLWQQYGPFLSSTQALSDEELASDPRILQLREDVVAQVEGLSISKVKVFDLQGRTVFSTDLAQIGADKSKSAGFLSAKSGQVISQLGHRDTFKALKETIKDRHLLSSYIPIRTNGPDGDIVGVFEMYTDVTPLVLEVNSTQRDIIYISLLVLGLLYGILFLFMRRANGLIKRQYQQLQDSEGRYRQQADELQQALTELQRTQTQMLQNEKMSSLGQLVAGVAHEINNPVNFIHGNLTHVQGYAQDLLDLLQLYQHHYPEPASDIQAEVDDIDLDFIQDDLPKTITSMQVGSDRIREIVLALRNFSRLDEAELKPVDIHEGLENTLMILQHRLKACPERPEIQVIRDYATLPTVECYAGLLNQVFMNILANAIDALEERAQKQTYQDCVEHPNQITLRTSLIDDRWVQVAIADNGLGIPEETQRRIFDPFFTTKPIGQGTGMGMSISYQIVTERHQGKLNCFSAPDQGTEFMIQIPVRQTADNQVEKP